MRSEPALVDQTLALLERGRAGARDAAELSSEVWRAMRVVVDTGIHSQGLTRQQAREHFRSKTAQDDRAIEVEIERYVSDPGLGVAYTRGAIRFRELRALAEKELGAALDIRAFHDQALAGGALPLDLLEARVRAWIASRKAADAKAPAEPGRRAGQGFATGARACSSSEDQASLAFGLLFATAVL